MAKNAELVNEEVTPPPAIIAPAGAIENKPRSDAQKAAFQRCLDKRHQLMETKCIKPEIAKTLHKEKKRAELKAAEAAEATPVVEPIVKKKLPKVVYEDESDDDDEQQIVIVKKKKKVAKKVIYQYESSDEEEEPERKPKAKSKAQAMQPTQPLLRKTPEKPKELPFNFIIC